MKYTVVFFILFSFKLLSYEYLIYYNETNQLLPLYIMYYDESGNIWYKYESKSGNITTNSILTDIIARDHLYYIYSRPNGSGLQTGYCNKEEFSLYYKNDIVFLNSLYKQALNSFLNYLYNDNFRLNNIIQYSNYELLYNDDGFIVESIVDGVWSGLYDNSEKSISGKLYSSSGELLYVDGEPVSWIEQKIDFVFNKTIESLKEVMCILARPVAVVIAAVFSLLILKVVLKWGVYALRGYDKNDLNVG